MGDSQISYDDATAEAYALAVEWGYTYCPRTPAAHTTYGNPPTYYVDCLLSLGRTKRRARTDRAPSGSATASLAGDQTRSVRTRRHEPRT